MIGIWQRSVGCCKSMKILKHIPSLGEFNIFQVPSVYFSYMITGTAPLLVDRCDASHLSNMNFCGTVSKRNLQDLEISPFFRKVTLYTQIRFKSRGKKHVKENTDEEDEDSEEEEDDTDVENDEFNKYFDEDTQMFSDNFKEVKKYVKSLRIDAIISGGLNIARNQVDNYLLSSNVRVNHAKVLKKSKQVKEGDCVDLVSETVDEGKGLKVKRVRVVKVIENKSGKGKMVVYLRCWRANTVIDNYDNVSNKW